MAEDAGIVGVLHSGVRGADPVVQRQIVQAVARAGGNLEGLHDQHEERHHHGQEQEHEQEGHHGLLGLAQRHQSAAAALAAHGGIGLADAHDALVAHQNESRQTDQNDGHSITDAAGTLVDEHAHLGGQRVVTDAVAQVGGHAVCTDRLGDGHDQCGQHGGHDQRQGDVAQNLGLVSALDLAHLLQLGVDGAKCAGHLDVGECIVVKGHAEHDGDRAIGQPVRNWYSQAPQKAVGAAGGSAEHRQPGQSLGPRGDHVRHGDQQDFLARQVRADHQPSQDGAQRHGNQRGANTADQGVAQRLPQDGLAHIAGQHVFPIVQSKVAHFAVHAAQLRLSQGEGLLDHGQQGDHDQAEQHNQADQHDHVERVFHHIQNQVFQPCLRHALFGKIFL